MKMICNRFIDGMAATGGNGSEEESEDTEYDSDLETEGKQSGIDFKYLFSTTVVSVNR